MHALAPSLPAWLDRELYPFQPRRLELEDGALSYLDEGDGSPVVLVHGTPSWSFEWRHVVRGLAPTHRVLAPDHLGFGLSDGLNGAGAKPADHARRLLAWFDALDLHDVTVVLHDFGGPIGLPLALDRPARVKRLVLANTWAWPLSDRFDTRWMSRLMETPLGRFLYLRLNASPRWIVPSAYADRARLTPAIHRHYLAPFDTPQRRVAAWTLAVELCGSDPYYASLRDRLGELDVPTLLLWGTKDPAFGPRELATFREHLPHAEVVELDDAGHFPQEEQPEACVRALQRWLGVSDAAGIGATAV